MRKRVHYTPEEKQHHIRECDRSGMSKKAYAESQGISPINLYRWHKQYGSGSGDETASEQNVEFIPLHIQHTDRGSQSVEVIFPDGIRVTFPDGTSPSYIGQVLATLRA